MSSFKEKLGDYLDDYEARGTKKRLMYEFLDATHTPKECERLFKEFLDTGRYSYLYMHIEQYHPALQFRFLAWVAARKLENGYQTHTNN